MILKSLLNLKTHFLSCFQNYNVIIFAYFKIVTTFFSFHFQFVTTFFSFHFLFIRFYLFLTYRKQNLFVQKPIADKNQYDPRISRSLQRPSSKAQLQKLERQSGIMIERYANQTIGRQKRVKINKGSGFQSFLTREKCIKAMELFDLNVPIPHIKRQLQIAQKTIYRMKDQYLFFGTISHSKGYQKRYGRSVKQIQEEQAAKRQVQRLLKENCAHTMGTLKRALEENGFIKQIPTLYKYLRELKYTRKKIRKVQLERNTREKLMYRKRYCEMISKIPIENQIFLDETTFYQNTAKEFGWAPIGQSAFTHVPANQKKHVTLLAAISVRGFEATKIIVGKFRCRHILEFIEHYLDHMEPHQVLVLDNARYHHSVLVKEKLQELNRPVRYLPAYSPQLNPIERVFGSIKRRYKKWKSLVEMSVPEINELIEKCVQDVATKDFREYYDEYEEWIKKGIEGEFFV